MAKAASERSDVTVVTSDNPRTEDPQSILDEVLTGIVTGREWIAIIDRREAVAHAIKLAKPGDVVVIAGKGHENYQIIGRTKYPMDDRELAKSALSPSLTLVRKWREGVGGGRFPEAPNNQKPTTKNQPIFHHHPRHTR